MLQVTCLHIVLMFFIAKKFKKKDTMTALIWYMHGWMDNHVINPLMLTTAKTA